MPLSTGETINNRYRIVKLLGQGGFGSVYRAWDLNLRGPVAIKESLDASPAALKQFQLEASLLFNLRHTGLPKVFDAFSLPGQGQYLVMEYIDGEDLQTMLERSGGAGLPEAQVTLWILQTCDALEYLHRQNPPIIHRDIKPANIRITQDGQAILVDFGIAKTYDPNQRTTLGARAVTPGFSPPEQYGAGGTDLRSDIYALGATCYVLLTGRTPPESIEIMSGGAHPLRPAHLVEPRLSAGVSAAIERAMQLKRTERFDCIREFKVSLQARAAAQPAAAPPNPPQLKPSLLVTAPAGLQATTYLAPARLSDQSPEIVLTVAPNVSLVLVNIPAGLFNMGSDKKDRLARQDEKPQHSVELKEYWISKYPVTNALYAVFTQATQHRLPEHWKRGIIPKGKEDHPVVFISWDDAAAFCQWASQISGYRLRLPSEAEWEKSASGPSGSVYPWGGDPPDASRCNFKKLVGTTTSVGRYSPSADSPYGCSDMSGNVWEWCLDWYSHDYATRALRAVTHNPRGPASGVYRALRGGAWNSSSQVIRSACRDKCYPDTQLDYIGFRCVHVP